MIPVDALDLATLPSVAHTALHDAPDLSAVYFVLDADGHVLYIGATISLWQRWNSSPHHQRSNLRSHACWTVAWLSIPSEDLAKVEAQAIAYFRPLYNGKKIPERRVESTMMTTLALQCVRRIAAITNETQYAITERLLIAEWQRLGGSDFWSPLPPHKETSS